MSSRDVCLRSLKRTLDTFISNYGLAIPPDDESQRKRLRAKILDEYAMVKDMDPPQPVSKKRPAPGPAQQSAEPTDTSAVETMLNDIEAESPRKTAIVPFQAKVEGSTSTAIVPRKPVQFARPTWHAPWKLMRVISGHLGWVRCVCVDPTNEWFATGSADRTIKIWDLASGQLRLTLTGHINTVRQVCVSPRHPYLFSVGEDKMVKCWDLECNKVVRHYHGHLSGVYCAAIHPTLDILITGGRDSVARVWDMRTKTQIHVLAGHNNTVMSLLTQPTDPQIISGSSDTTVKLWDLAAGKAMCTLTNHKKAVRAMVVHPAEHTFVSGGADNLKKWKLPHGNFLQNLTGHNAIVNALAINQDGVLFSGGDNGSMHMWDYTSGHSFQQLTTQAQPGSLDSETGVFASAFDLSGTRLIVGEADKSIKIWKEDDLATPETHPVVWTPNTNAKRY